MSHHLGQEGDENTPLIIMPTTTPNPDDDLRGPAPLLHRTDEVPSGGGGGYHHPNPHHQAPGELQPGLDLEDVMYSANSFWAVMKPVSITMFVASMVVVNVDYRTATGSDDQGMSVYQVNEGDASGEGGDSNSVKLGKSLINALIIVGGICAATFVVVCLYRFRCMKVLVGYMAFSCIMLLGLMGGLLWQTALVVWNLPCDMLTFFLTLYNFAVVGVTAIFYQRGIPMVVTQGYLVAISVIMAWQLSRFEEWTGWCLLVVLALYDLCAVLTPCGPLKYLVGLMQEYNEPMPGLLYEAELPEPAQQAATTTSGGGTAAAGGRRAGGSGRAGGPPPPPPGSAVVPLGPLGELVPSSSRGGGQQQQHGDSRELGEVMVGSEHHHDTLGADGVRRRGPHHHHHHQEHEADHISSSEVGSGEEGEDDDDGGGGALSPPRSTEPRRAVLAAGESPRDATPLLAARGTGGSRQHHHHHHQPGGGGEAGSSHAGVPHRLEEHHGEEEGEEEEEIRQERSIKLGLGDFVFYSVLVSKAALYGFATCAACFLVIITGLGATLVLLSVFRKALPALPISIGLGVLFYLLTRLVIIPYINNLASHPLYV